MTGTGNVCRRQKHVTRQKTRHEVFYVALYDAPIRLGGPCAREAGVAVIDVAGAGGTSWAAVEGERARDDADRAVAMAFADWGIPTPASVQAVRRVLPTVELIAPGGIRDGVDVARAIRLGADIAGQAAGVLGAATVSTEAVVGHFRIVIRQLAVACFCTGSADLAALRQARLLSSTCLQSHA